MKGKELLRGHRAATTGQGEVTLVVRVVNGDTVKASKVQPGELLVGTKFGPQHDAYMEKAGGVATDLGGANDHVHMYLKEQNALYGKNYRAITGTGGATSVLKDGQKVVLVTVAGYEPSKDPKKPGKMEPFGAVYEWLPDEPPAGGQSISDKMAEQMAKMGIKLDPKFMDSLKKKGY